MSRSFASDPALRELETRLQGITRHCLADLGAGLTAFAEGDLTRGFEPVTSPIAARGRTPQVRRVAALFIARFTIAG